MNAEWCKGIEKKPEKALREQAKIISQRSREYSKKGIFAETPKDDPRIILLDYVIEDVDLQELEMSRKELVGFLIEVLEHFDMRSSSK